MASDSEIWQYEQALYIFLLEEVEKFSAEIKLPSHLEGYLLECSSNVFSRLRGELRYIKGFAITDPNRIVVDYVFEPKVRAELEDTVKQIRVYLSEDYSREAELGVDACWRKIDEVMFLAGHKRRLSPDTLEKIYRGEESLKFEAERARDRIERRNAYARDFSQRLQFILKNIAYTGANETLPELRRLLNEVSEAVVYMRESVWLLRERLEEYEDMVRHLVEDDKKHFLIRRAEMQECRKYSFEVNRQSDGEASKPIPKKSYAPARVPDQEKPDETDVAEFDDIADHLDFAVPTSGSVLGYISDFGLGWFRRKKAAKSKRAQIKDKVYEDVSASVFAPAAVKRGEDMRIRVKIHQTKDYDVIFEEIRHKDPTMVNHDTATLNVALSHGTKIDMRISANGVDLNRTEYSVVWNGKACEVTFIAEVPHDTKRERINFCIDFYANGLSVGCLSFQTEVVDFDADSTLWTQAHGGAHRHVFISYASQDREKVRYLHKAYESMKVPHFFDRASLVGGDEYWDVIRNEIHKTDLFVLCWSSNAAVSEGVKIEKDFAMERYNKEKSAGKVQRLRFLPLDITPHAELPDDMKQTFHFDIIE